MKFCSKCDNSPLPFIMVFVIATVCAFMTWLTLGLSIPEPAPRAAASVLTFAVVGGSLLTYIISCLRRHCRHRDQYARDRADGGLPAERGSGQGSPRGGHLERPVDLGASA